MSRGIWGLILVAALFSTACTTGSAQTARTNGQGNFQFGVEPGAIGIAASGETFIAPSFNLAGRYGISDGVDIGARIGSVTYEVQAKFMLTDPSATDSLAMSLAPQVTAIGAGGSGGGGFFLRSVIPLLIGLPVGDSEFTFGPRVSPWLITGGGGGSSAGGLVLFVGGEAGFAARVGDKFWLMPHFVVDYPLVGVAGGTGSGGVSGSLGNGAFFGAGVALLFGGRGRGPAAPAAAPPAATME